MTGGRPMLRIGAVLRLAERTYSVRALSTLRELRPGGTTTVTLLGNDGEVLTTLAGDLLADPTFELLDSQRPRVPADARLDGLRTDIVTAARALERHVREVLYGEARTGLPADPQFDPASTSLFDRQQRKVAQTANSTSPIALGTLRRYCRDYQQEGLWALVDRRLAPQPQRQRGDAELMAAITECMDREIGESTGERGRLRVRVERLLRERHGPDFPMPSKATVYRRMHEADRGRHTFDSAKARESAALRPDQPYQPRDTYAPGEVEADATVLNVEAILSPGVVGRPHLLTLKHPASRSVLAATLHAGDPSAVDSGLLLARGLVPERMRPGWPEFLALQHSALPYERLISIDQRLEDAAARPVVMIDTLIWDRAKIAFADSHLRICEHVGISFAPAQVQRPTSKPFVERSFGSFDSLFLQHIKGYVGRNAQQRGHKRPKRLWTLAELQELLDEFVVSVWQTRKHAKLRHPLNSKIQLSPNEMAAALLARDGYVPVPLGPTDYIELMPAVWRTVNHYGIQLDHRIYDSAALRPYYDQPSGLPGRRQQWEIHHDPLDINHIWLRDHRIADQSEQWIAVPWTLRAWADRPFSDAIWSQAVRLTRDGDDPVRQEEIAKHARDLLDRVQAGPPRGPGNVARRTAARKRLRQNSRLHSVPLPEAGIDGYDVDPQREATGPRRSLGVFDPHDGAN